jgi:hypothetical protein
VARDVAQLKKKTHHPPGPVLFHNGGIDDAVVHELLKLGNDQDDVERDEQSLQRNDEEQPEVRPRRPQPFRLHRFLLPLHRLVKDPRHALSMRRFQVRAHLFRLAELLERLLQGVLVRHARGLVLGDRVQKVLAQLLAHVLAHFDGPADAAADLIEVLLKLFHRISPGWCSRQRTIRSTIPVSL